MPLIYAFVARRQTVLAEFTNYSGNFSTIATQALEKLSDDNTRFTYTADGHTFNYVVENGFTYLVVADSEFGRHVPFACLDRIKAEFTRDHASEAQDAIAHSLNKAFAPRLKEHLEFCSANPESVSKVNQVQQQVSQVKEIMMDNIEKVLDRGEKIELLVDKSDALRFQADNFVKTGRALKRKMWCDNMKMKVIFAIIALALPSIAHLRTLREEVPLKSDLACHLASCTNEATHI